MKSCGLRASPTPGAAPVTITPPGFNVMKDDRIETRLATGKTMAEIDTFCTGV